MSLLNLTLPSIGQPNSTEDVKIVNALTAIQSVVNGNLDSSNFAAQPAYQSLALVNGLNTRTLNYYKDNLGTVHFRGDPQAVVSPGISTSTLLGTLPVGYRPGIAISVMGYEPGTTTICDFGIATDGKITAGFNANIGTLISFGNVSFRAEL